MRCARRKTGARRANSVCVRMNWPRGSRRGVRRGCAVDAEPPSRAPAARRIFPRQGKHCAPSAREISAPTARSPRRESPAPARGRAMCGTRRKAWTCRLGNTEKVSFNRFGMKSQAKSSPSVPEACLSHAERGAAPSPAPAQNSKPRAASLSLKGRGGILRIAPTSRPQILARSPVLLERGSMSSSPLEGEGSRARDGKSAEGRVRGRSPPAGFSCVRRSADEGPQSSTAP